ncbi:MAG: hypothetical protein AAFQ66_08830 [Pseudomonadota bacterium]
MRKTPQKHPIDFKVADTQIKAGTVLGAIIACVMYGITNARIVLIVWGLVLHAPDAVQSSLSSILEAIR